MRKALLLIAVGVSMFAGPELFGAGREAEWSAVDAAVKKGLPRTALEALERIIPAAERDKAYGEAAKAIGRKIVLEGNIQGNKAEEKITRLEAEIARAPREIVPLLETLLGNWYWHYFQNNRWRFLNRTATAQAPGGDFTTWDLPRLFSEIDRVFTRALSAAERLRRTPVSDFDDLLEKGTVPDAWRPTLYDFVAHEALRFYTSGEQAAAKPEDAFEIFADQPVHGLVPVFGTAEEFLAGKIERTATESALEKAFFLFRDLLAFHRPDADPVAYADADLARLVWANNIALGPEKAGRYQAALQAFSERWARLEVSALALHHWAGVRQAEGDLVGARRLAERGRQSFPASVGGRMCQNLVTAIEAPSASITTERVWNAPWPAISVRYRNVTNVHFRAVAWDWNIFLERKHARPEYPDDAIRQEMLAKAPALAWSAQLPATADYQERVEELAAPATLPPGFYFIIASHNAEFSGIDNPVTFTDVWVSDLALVVRPHDGAVEGFVLEAGSGEPITGAEVMAWFLDDNGNRQPQGPAARTDTNGRFTIPTAHNRNYLLRARAKVGATMHELGSMQEYSSYPVPEAQSQTQTLFFTDRALYRPGQTIQYKGICLRQDQKSDTYAVLAGTRLTVMFADPNGKEISRAEHQANDYGSFSGSFTAPRDRVMGRMQILVHQGPAGAAMFNVEEYKRPKFQVTLEAPKTPARLNDRVEVQGKAGSYTGAAVDGALVKYRVMRTVRWPDWWGWFPWRSPRVQGSQEIAHGTTRTGADGTFQVAFNARPDPAVREQDEASFGFSVSADVTDPAGETRSAQRTVNVGFAALRVSLSAADWQTASQPVAITVSAASLDGEPLPATGILRIHRLKEPERVRRSSLTGPGFRGGFEDAGSGSPDLSDPRQWEPGPVTAEKPIVIDAMGSAIVEFNLAQGAFRATWETQDAFGRKVTSRLPLLVLAPEAPRFGVKIPHEVASPSWTVEPGQEFMAVWGTGYDTGRAFIEIEIRHEIVERYWTSPGVTQQQIRRRITEAMRGGFTLHVTQVRENRGYLTSRRVDVPWSNKLLDVRWEHFTSKLEPGRKETWTAVLSTPDVVAGAAGKTNRTVTGQGPPPGPAPRAAEGVVAEMVATLYDESLDQHLGHHWPARFGVFREDYSMRGAAFANLTRLFQRLMGSWEYRSVWAEATYRAFPPDLVANFSGFQFARAASMEGAMLKAPPMAAPAPIMMKAGEGASNDALTDVAGSGRGDALARNETRSGKGSAPPGPDLSQVTARRNLNETAFFLPQLLSGPDGVVRMQFTMPEALTRWRFMGFAHDRQLRGGMLEAHAVTAKDLMVQPNPPRFLREGDTLEFTVKVSNQTPARQQGKVRLTFRDARDQQSVDALLGNLAAEVGFDIPGRESRTYSWRIRVPDGAPFLTYQAVASTGRVSDGEEGYLPVLSRRIFVTESMPLPIRGKAGGAVTRRFQFEKLLRSGRSDTLRHQGLTVQMVSQPAWYAVMALPYLMEYPYECTEQTFNRFYANALARHIANADPKMRRVFDQWKGTPALDSPLAKNQDLKSVLIEETPWLAQANSESEARRNVGILFDANRLEDETARTLRKLSEMQLGDGSWPWFPGGRGNDYITLYITTGFGRLRHLGAPVEVGPALRSLQRLDEWMEQRHREILKRPRPGEYIPSATDALYLYGRSFFLKDRPVAPAHRAAVEFFLGQSRRLWLKLADRQSQGHLAIALRRFDRAAGRDDPAPRDIMKSLGERSVSNEEMGMFWRETELSWWWYRAPIETQAMMIEAFDEVMGDARAVEDCRVWLIKQKQTQDWKTTKATADAIYALLLRGRDLLASDTLVEVSAGGIDLTPRPGAGAGRPARAGTSASAAPEAGTGFYERKFSAAEVRPKLGEITVRKLDEGVAWGGVHWQYLEDLSKVTPHEGTPLKLRKSIHTRVNTGAGPVLQPVSGPVRVGDELVVRIELRVDRDMEYVHLKDQRGSGTEPVDVLSQYKFQDGLAYYESTRDTASHFFIDYLPKGVYVFEYSTRVQHRGLYQTGVAEIQCLYAPEFNSHSGSVELTVR